MRKKNGSAKKLVHVVQDFVVDDAETLDTLIEDYRAKLKGEEIDSTLTAEQMLDEIIKFGLHINTGVKILKIVLGKVFSTIKSTTDNNTYNLIITKKFELTTQTADRYALIYDVLYSGTFLYSLPDKYNPLDLSMRDMETLSQLVATGEHTEERIDMLFSDGDWITKRDQIRDEVPEVVERNGKRDKERRRRKTKRRFTHTGMGSLLYDTAPNSKNTNQYKIGVLYIDDPDPTVQTLAKRALEAIEKELKERMEVS